MQAEAPPPAPAAAPAPQPFSANEQELDKAKDAEKGELSNAGAAAKSCAPRSKDGPRPKRSSPPPACHRR
jgi:hypothetical protein